MPELRQSVVAAFVSLSVGCEWEYPPCEGFEGWESQIEVQVVGDASGLNLRLIVPFPGQTFEEASADPKRRFDCDPNDEGSTLGQVDGVRIYCADSNRDLAFVENADTVFAEFEIDGSRFVETLRRCGCTTGYRLELFRSEATGKTVSVAYGHSWCVR